MTHRAVTSPPMRRPKCDGMLHKAWEGIGFGQDRALSAAETLPILFKRRLDTHQMTFAMGEALAHLHYLWMQGKVKRFLDQAGVQRFCAGNLG